MKIPSHIAYITDDLLAQLDGITVKSMFGGYGLYLDGAIFAFTDVDGGLMLKGNEDLRSEYESLGGKQFIYEGHRSKGPTAMPYWTIPESIMEDREKLCTWVVRSAELSKKK